MSGRGAVRVEPVFASEVRSGDRVIPEAYVVAVEGVGPTRDLKVELTLDGGEVREFDVEEQFYRVLR